MDECKESLDKCHSHANCTNTEGSYTCHCKPGYFGDGFTCEKGETVNSDKGDNCQVKKSPHKYSSKCINNNTEDMHNSIAALIFAY